MNKFDELLTLEEFILANGDVAMWENVNIEPSYQLPIIKEIVEDWFTFRRITDNDRFAKYFNRKARILSRQYSQLFRCETTEIDPMVANYLERENDFERTLTILRDIEGTNEINSTGNNTSTRTPELDVATTNTGTVSTANTGTVSDSGTTDTVNTFNNDTTGNSTDNTTGHSMSLDGKLPMSAAYGTGGFPDSLNWINATAQSESDSKGTSISDTTSNENGDSSVNGTVENTQTLDTNTLITNNLLGSSKTTGTDKTVDATTGNTDSINKSTENGTHTDKTNTKEIFTGRTGVLPSDALTKYRDYAYSTNSTEWFINELEVLFMPEYY